MTIEGGGVRHVPSDTDMQITTVLRSDPTLLFDVIIGEELMFV